MDHWSWHAMSLQGLFTSSSQSYLLKIDEIWRSGVWQCCSLMDGDSSGENISDGENVFMGEDALLFNTSVKSSPKRRIMVQGRVKPVKTDSEGVKV